MRIDIVTLFPSWFESPLSQSLLKRARSKGRVKFYLHNPRDFTKDRHRTVDSKPYGGGAGMVLKPEPLFRCVESIPKGGYAILLSARGKAFTQGGAARLAKKRHLVLICGHYEGVDERVAKYLADEEISVGDFVTLGGEAPALCLIEAVVRLVPGVLGNPDSLKEESFSGRTNGIPLPLLEFPQYTRPRVFRGWKVPGVLVSGNHQAIEAWRGKEALVLTRKRQKE